MRVLQITEPLCDGVGRHVTDVASGLHQRGHQVHVIYSPLRCDPLLVQELDSHVGISTMRLAMRRSPHWSDAAALLAIWRYVLRHGPFDVIHAHSSKAGALTRLAASIGTAGVIYTPHAFVTMSTSEFGPWKLRLYRMIERALAPFASRIICTATSEFTHARDRLGVAETKLVMLLNSVDPTTLNFDSDLRRELGLPPTTPIVGFVGRLAPQKGTDVAIRAFPAIRAACPTAMLVIIGDGAERESLERLAREQQVSESIRWLGTLPARKYLHNFDILLCPSRYDGGAYVPIEGLYCGLPVICTPVGVAPEVITNGINGFVVPVDDAAGFAARAIDLLHDPDLRSRISDAARQLSTYFLPDRMLDELEEVYFGRLSGWRPLRFAAGENPGMPGSTATQ